MTSSRDRLPRRIVEGIRRAFAEFLTVPLIVVVAFILLAVAVHVVDADAGRTATWGPIWRLLARYVGDASSSNSLLGTIAGSVITVTSITFSILLLAVQQGASALTSQIVDNYLRRKVNQFYFGFFVGTSIYALVTLSLSSPSVRPVLGVTLAMIFSITALLSLVLLIYSTIDQTRPVTIINQIRDATLRARDAQNAWLPRTAAPSIASGYPIVSQTSSYLARVLLARLEALLRDRPGVRIDIGLPVGDYVPCGAALAFVTTPVPPDDGLARAIRAALPVEQQRDIACDAGFGIDQMETIAWTAISTAKSNPAAGVIACHALEDVLFRWSTAHDDRLAAGAGQAISYPDRVPDQLLGSFESLFVVASESMQHQSLAVIMDTLAQAFPHMPESWKDRVERIVLNSLAALGDHVPTRLIEASLGRMVAALDGAGRCATAARVKAAADALQSTSGTINARGNRA